MTQLNDPPEDPIAPPSLPGKRARLVRVSDVPPERIGWLWPGHLARGKLHDVTGDPGLGKSTVTLDLAARVTTGKPWPDGQPGSDPAGVVLISVEDGIGDAIRPRLDAAGADTTRVTVLTEIDITDPAGQVTERLPELPTDVDVIGDAITAIGAALVVIDPLMAFLSAGINAHRDQDVRRALSPLIRVAETTGTAVVIVRHLNKGDSDNAMYRGGGSIGIIGAARIGFTVGRHPDDPDNTSRAVIAGTKSNICPLPGSLAYTLHHDETADCAHLQWDGDVPYSAGDLLRPASNHRSPDHDPTTQWLITYLTDHDGSASFDDIRTAAAEAGIAERTLRRARKRASVISERTGMPARATWRLPAADDQSGQPPPEPGRTGRSGRTDDPEGDDTTSPATQPQDVAEQAGEAEVAELAELEQPQPHRGGSPDDARPYDQQDRPRRRAR